MRAGCSTADLGEPIHSGMGAMDKLPVQLLWIRQPRVCVRPFASIWPRHRQLPLSKGR